MNDTNCKSVYNNITSQEKLKKINKENLQLTDDFIDYLYSVDRSINTIKHYKRVLNVFWCWNLEFNNNKFFIDITKREFIKFQSHTINIWGWSPKRIRNVKAVIGSLSNYIENILDDEYKGYKSVIKKIESPTDVPIKKKTIFTDDELTCLLSDLVKEKKYMQACALSLAMNSGRRKSELARFKVSYFTPENLICDGALYKTPEKVTTKGRGSRGKQIELYVFAKSFQPYLDLWLEERNKLNIHSDWLFPLYENGEWIDEKCKISTLNSYARTFSERLKRSFYWHSLRHYFTTKLKNSGMPDEIIQLIIGWESIDMIKVYDDTSIDDKLKKYFENYNK